MIAALAVWATGVVLSFLLLWYVSDWHGVPKRLSVMIVAALSWPVWIIPFILMLWRKKNAKDDRNT